MNFVLTVQSRRISSSAILTAAGFRELIRWYRSRTSDDSHWPVMSDCVGRIKPRYQWHSAVDRLGTGMSLRVLILVLCLPLAANAQTVDFTTYDVPLYRQIVDRISTHIVAKVGDRASPRDRYFIVPFAYQNEYNDPEYSHSFISVVRVFGDKKHTKVISGPGTTAYSTRKFQAFTISWLPRDFLENPNLRVFEGFASRVIQANNACPLSDGRNFSLAQTIKLAVAKKNAVAMWGPYEIGKDGFRFWVRRKQLLEGGTIKYRADDRQFREDLVAINCVHAMDGLEQPYSTGGIFGTGFRIWGFNGTARVLLDYNNQPCFKGMLIEPVDVKKDRYVFVYAPTRDGLIKYNPARNASAYHI